MVNYVAIESEIIWYKKIVKNTLVRKLQFPDNIT